MNIKVNLLRKHPFFSNDIFSAGDGEASLSTYFQPIPVELSSRRAGLRQAGMWVFTIIQSSTLWCYHRQAGWNAQIVPDRISVLPQYAPLLYNVQFYLILFHIGNGNAHINRDGSNFKICNPTFKKKHGRHTLHFTIATKLLISSWIPSSSRMDSIQWNVVLYLK